jgi:hypothetical protein
MDEAELKIALDQSDELCHGEVFDIFARDLRARGERFTMPSDPMKDPGFIEFLSKVYNPGTPAIYPPEPEEEPIAA